MRCILVSLALLCTLGFLQPLDATAAITIATVPVGNPFNANDSTGLGEVDYNYSIGTYDVTVGQYTAFLNAVAKIDTYGLYNSSITADLNVAGISRSGTSGNYTYSVIGSANHPITLVSWGDAARFANWLYNGQPTTGGETLSTTEDGSYYLNGAITATSLNAVMRKTNATWVIPTENEWYKAAYYNPASSTYYQYPYSSNTVPTSGLVGSVPNTGNYAEDYTGTYAVTGSSTYSSTQNYLTDVGAYTASASPYSAFDMGGDVWQWNETLISGPYRGIRGGSWYDGSTNLLSSFRYEVSPLEEDDGVGFRVALVAEPSTAVLASIAGGLIWTLRKRCK